MHAARIGEDFTLLVSGSKDTSVRVWHAESGTCLAKADSHAASVTAVAFAQMRPAAFLVTGGADKLLKVHIRDCYHAWF